MRLTYSQLETNITRNKRDWIVTLENQKAVYLITDTKTGNQNILDPLGFAYVKDNFQYSTQENYNARTDDHFIFPCESWWQNILGTRAFGLNSN